MPRFQAETHEEGEPHWYPVDRVPEEWRRDAAWPLLSEQGPLTGRIRSRCPESFRLELMSQGPCVLDEPSASWLREVSGSSAHRREVRLWCGSRPIVYGKTLFPARLASEEHDWLEQLGARPLGDAFFTLPGGRRRGLSIARIRPDDPLAYLAGAGIDKRCRPQGDSLWARRSLLETDTLRLLVTECLLGNL